MVASCFTFGSFGMSPEFWAAGFGALVGAFVGGFIAYKIQLLVIKQATEEREAGALEQKRALGFSLLEKMKKLHTNLQLFHKHLEDSFKKVTPNLQPWGAVKPLATSRASIHFSSEEMALVFSFSDSKLYNDMSGMDDTHNDCVSLFQTYGEKRYTLENMRPTGVSEGVGHVDLSDEELLEFQPRMIEVNSLLEDMRLMCAKSAPESRSALSRLHEALKEVVGLQGSLEFTGDDPPNE